MTTYYLSNSYGMATVCPPGKVPNKMWRKKRGQRQCIKPKATLRELRKIARANDVSIYAKKRDGSLGKALSEKALKLRLSRMKVPYPGSRLYRFGMATVCPPGYSPNKMWRKKRGQRQCIKDKKPKKSLKALQALARSNDVSIYQRRKDGMGFTKKPLSMKALKYRLSKMRVSYK